MENTLSDVNFGQREFDAAALYEALNAERVRRGLSWRLTADHIWEQSAELNRQRNDHPISPSTLTDSSSLNLGAVWFAARPAEAWHATLHAVLAVLFGLGAQRLAARRRAA